MPPEADDCLGALVMDTEDRQVAQAHTFFDRPPLRGHHNAAHIVHCVNTYGDLVARVEAAEAEVEKLRRPTDDQDAMCAQCAEVQDIEHRAGCPICGKDFL